MDQDAFRTTFRDMNDRYCLFEKSILSGECACSQANRFCLAEREGVHCKSDGAQRQCEELLELLRHHTRFTLKSSNDTGALPHGKAIRIQIGGLRGLNAAVLGDEALPASKIDDIHGLINRALDSFGRLEDFPFQEIIKQVAAYKGRRRSLRS